MLVSTFELISLAASNSLAAFCFCNLIIAILLVGSVKPSSQFEEEERPNDFSTVVYNDKFNKNEVTFSGKANELIEAEEENVLSLSISKIENEEEGPSEVDNVNDDDNDDTDDEDDDADDLRKRVEEFIEKINKEWRAETLKTCALGQ